MSNDEELPPLEMYQKMLLHPRVQANAGTRQYIQDQIDLMQREPPPPDSDPPT
jgi:hypothetical protein